MAQNCRTLKVISVCAHMTVEVATLRKSSIAYLALIRLFSSMSTEVLCQCGAVGKSFIANVALVRSISRVCTHVSSHGTTLREPAITDWTLEWFLTTVSPKMCCKVGSLSEGLLTDRTLVWFLARMGPEMCFQGRLSSVSLATHVTGVVSRENLISARGKLREITRKGRYVGHCSCRRRVTYCSVCILCRLRVR